MVSSKKKQAVLITKVRKQLAKVRKVLLARKTTVHGNGGTLEIAFPFKSRRGPKVKWTCTVGGKEKAPQSSGEERERVPTQCLRGEEFGAGLTTLVHSRERKRKDVILGTENG